MFAFSSHGQAGRAPLAGWLLSPDSGPLITDHGPGTTSSHRESGHEGSRECHAIPPKPGRGCRAAGSRFPVVFEVRGQQHRIREITREGIRLATEPALLAARDPGDLGHGFSAQDAQEGQVFRSSVFCLQVFCLQVFCLRRSLATFVVSVPLCG